MLDLWLPILISTIAIFFMSFLSWMVLQLHVQDWQKMEGEDAVIEVMKKVKPPPGNYMFPGATSGKELNSPEFRARQMEGPNGIIQVLPDSSMGGNLAKTFVFFLICNATFAYLATIAFEPGEPFMNVFRFVATVALLTFLASLVQHSIWFRNRIVGHIIESIAFALIAGAIFAAFWPGS